MTHPRTTRPITLDDVPALVDVLVANRAFLAPWQSVRDDAYFTPAGQRDVVRDAIDLAGRGLGRVHVVLDEGRVVGRATLSGVVRGALQSCALGYWVAEANNGRGLATAAVAEMLDVAFGELRLHRVQAETLVHNTASQRVLERNGFTRYGTAPQYLRIAGTWQDHAMFQVLNPATEDCESGAGVSVAVGR
ncbi:GNAT family N-acetyltransferase [Cellulomonas sp. S1-8]|nr:GNAT family protein [Cellulomonas sp. S1-8]UZN02759.1 GNAT family N-acetyltransferase [Cellulomonas sp. S1-8]